jgi:hypothetical protein
MNMDRNTVSRSDDGGVYAATALPSAKGESEQRLPPPDVAVARCRIDAEAAARPRTAFVAFTGRRATTIATVRLR